MTTPRLKPARRKSDRPRVIIKQPRNKGGRPKGTKNAKPRASATTGNRPFWATVSLRIRDRESVIAKVDIKVMAESYGEALQKAFAKAGDDYGSNWDYSVTMKMGQ